MPGKTIWIKRFLYAFCILSSSIIFFACTNPSSAPEQKLPPSSTPRSGDLTPFLYHSATPSPQAITLPTISPPSSPSPTPRTHVVKKGEDMLGIAFLYRITLEELIAANPDVKPNLMSIGTVLVIPGQVAPIEGQATQSASIQATAIPVRGGPIFCTLTQENGIWCAQAVTNENDFPLEGVSAIIHLVDTENAEVRSQTAFLPLDLLQPGQSLPLTTYFAPPAPKQFQTSTELISALPSPDDGRYLPVKIDRPQVFLSEDGLSAEIALEVISEQGESGARRVWVAAIAYDAQGNIIGLRRREKPKDQLLDAGQSLPVQLTVYSAAGPIQRVALAAEARP